MDPSLKREWHDAGSRPGCRPVWQVRAALCVCSPPRTAPCSEVTNICRKCSRLLGRLPPPSSLCLVQKGDHLCIRGLGEVVVVQADGIERFWRNQAHTSL